MRERENFMSIGFNFNNKALQSFVEKYDLKKTTVDVKGNKVRVDYDGDGRYDETINFDSKDIKYSYKEFDKENTATKKVGKYTVIDYDGDGRYDAKIKSKKLTKDNMSNPITLKCSSREVQELTEQRFALEYAYSAAIGRDVPDLKEGQKIKKLIAEIDKKLDKYGAGVGTAEFNKKLDEILPQAKKPVETVEEVDDEAAEVPVKETPVEEAAEEETGYKKGSQLKVTNPNNPNGAIDGKLEDFEQNADGMITKFSIKSDKSGKTFTYEYDAATKRYVNRAENKYYIMQEDGTLLRDNKLGRSAAPVPPVKPAEVKDEIIEQSEKAAAAITMKDVKPYGKGQFIDKDGKIYKLGKDGKFEHVGCANPEVTKPVEVKGPYSGVTYQQLKKEFDGTMFSVRKLNSFIEQYGEYAVKAFIQDYNKEAEKNGKSSITDQLIFTGKLDSRIKKILGLKSASTTSSPNDARIVAGWRGVH